MSVTHEPPVRDRIAATADHWTDKVQEAFRHPPAAYVIGAVEVLIGLLMFIQPERGAASLIDDIYKMPVGLYGVICVICGILLFGRVSLTQLFAFTVPVLMYIVATFVYTTNSSGGPYAAVVFYIGFYMLILRLFAQEGHATK